MTLEDLVSSEGAMLLAVTTAGVQGIKHLLPWHLTKRAGFRRSLPVIAAIVGAALASTGLIWAEVAIGQRVTAGALVGFLGPALHGMIKRRTKAA